MSDTAEGAVVNSKKIAFIQDGVILQVLDTDAVFADVILSNSQKVDITGLTDAESAGKNDLYDSSTGVITLVREPASQE